MFICWWEQFCRDLGQVHLHLSTEQEEIVASGRSKEGVPGRLVDTAEGRYGSSLPTRSVFSMKSEVNDQLRVRRKKRFEEYNMEQ